MDSKLAQFGTDQWFLDPSPWYDTMLQKAPIYFEERSNIWNVFKFSDVERALTQFSIFSSEFGGYSNEEALDPKMRISSGACSPPIPAAHETPQHCFQVLQSIVDCADGATNPRNCFGITQRSGTDKGHRHDHRFLGSFPVTVIAEMLGNSPRGSKEIQEMVGQ